MDKPGKRSGVDAPLDTYNQALRKGRHPRSFGRDATSTIWTSLKTSSARVSNIKIGQGLGSVVDKESSVFQLDSLPSAMSPEREEISLTRQSVSRGRGKTGPLSSPIDKDRRDRRPKKKHHGHEDVIKRLQALGSAETKSATSAVATNASNEIDTAKLRNDFSAQSDARLYYGSTIVLELFNGDLMMVSVADSTVVVHPLEHIKYQAKGARDKLLFTLVNLHELRSANPIKYGDSVWLQLSVGTGETSWEQGGVLGAKVRKAPELNALTLTEQKRAVGINSAKVPDTLSNVGFPIPVKAYLPKTREDSADSQIDDMQARLRNKSSRMLGRWIIRSAVANPDAKDNFVYNNHEIYLEQDWFYLGADLDPLTKSQVAVLRQLPPPKNHKPGEYVIERRAAWKIRLVDTSNGGLGLSLVQQQMERLLFKAKTQLKASERMREGDVRRYGKELSGGQNFPKQLRQHIQNVTSNCDQLYLSMQHDRLSNLNQYFEGKIASMATHRPSKLTPLGKIQRLRQTQSTSSIGPASSSSPVQSSSTAAELRATCNLCIANQRQGFNLCCHDHEVVQLLSTGSSLPPPSLSLMKSASDRSLLTSSEQIARAKIAEAADMRERDRIMRLLSDQDTRLLGVIKTNEHESTMAAIQRHAQDFAEAEDSSGYVFNSATGQKHAVKTFDTMPDIDEIRRQLIEGPSGNSKVEADESSSMEDGDDGDEFNDDGEAESSDSDDDFITEDEIRLLDFINIKKASALYANDEKALVEMLDGFADLAQNRIVPQLQDAIASHNKASLLETADLLARAAEFVVARRIQVHVMGLIQSVATSSVDDFTGIYPALDLLVEEVHGTVQSIEKIKHDMEICAQEIPPFDNNLGDADSTAEIVSNPPSER